MKSQKMTTKDRLKAIDRSVHARLARLSSKWVYILQATVGAGLAYWVAKDLIGHEEPFFAPMAVVIILGLSGGERLKRAIEMAIGGVLGVGFGEALVLLIGGGFWQIPLIVGLGLTLASLVTKSQLITNQIVIGAVLIATILQPGSEVGGFHRMIDALVGSIIGVLVIALIPTSPLKEARHEIQKVLALASSVLHDVAEGLRNADTEPIELARSAVGGSQTQINAMLAAAKSGQEAAELSPLRWGSQRLVRSLQRILDPVDNCIRNVRVLARRCLVLVQDGDQVSDTQLEIIEELSDITLLLSDLYEGKKPLNEANEIPEVVHRLRVLAGQSGVDVVKEPKVLSGYAILAHTRSIIVDLLMVCGMSRESAVATLEPTSTTPAYPPEIWED